MVPRKSSIDPVKMLRAITGLHRNGGCNAVPSEESARLLKAFLELSGSKSGVVAEVVRADGASMLMPLAISDAARCSESESRVERSSSSRPSDPTPDSSLGELLRIGQRLLTGEQNAVAPVTGICRSHLPPHSFAVLPLVLDDCWMGMVGLTHRDDGYDDALLDALEPLLHTAAQVLRGLANHREHERVQQRLVALLQGAPDALVTVDDEGLVLDANQAALAIVGADLVGWPLHLRLGLTRLPDPGTRVSTTTQDARTRLLEVARGNVVPGDAPCSVFVIRDITEQEHVRTALIESEDRWQLALAASSDGVWDWDLLTGYVFFSPRWMEMLGYGPTELPHQLDTLIDLMHPDDLARVEEQMQAHLAGTTPQYTAEFRLRARSGQWRWCLSRGRIIRYTEDSRPWRFVGTQVDIHSQREQEAQLRAAKMVAESATRAKAAFLANMSHEIRTPMNAILGTSHLLRRTNLADDQMDLLQTIQTASEGLLRIVNDVLDLSKIESGKLDLEQMPFGLMELAHATRRTHGAAARQKGLTLEVRADEDLPQKVEGDFTRVMQVIHNLVGNAVKFTDTGGVRVELARLDSLDQETGLVTLGVSVEDTGIGIAPDALARIFLPFAQAEQSTTRRFGGTGLGLSICRRLVGLMGGELKVHSVVGEGSCFSFGLPLRVRTGLPSTRRERKIDGKTLSGHVLLVEDNPVNRVLMERILMELTSCEVDTAVDGARAVELARVNPYDVILMDCQMPVMDGYTASRQIRSLPGSRGKVPIIAQTANAFAEDRQACLAAGMDDFLTKPVDLTLLMDVLHRWLEHDSSLDRDETL